MALYTVTADETMSDSFRHTNYQQKPLQVTITGTFGGGTVDIQKQLPDSSWVTIPGASFGEPVAKNIDLKEEANIRYSVTGSSTPSLKIELL
jgi:hypothetical protein